MRLPYIDQFDKTPISIVMSGSVSETGVDTSLVVYEGRCFFTSSTKATYSGDGRKQTLKALALIKEGIDPNEASGGKALVGGGEYKVHSVNVYRNFDGSVHHTELELI
jgi:hypothetical protein